MSTLRKSPKPSNSSALTSGFSLSRRGAFGEESMMLSPQIANLSKPTLQPKSPDEEPSESSDDLQAKEFATGDPSPFKSQLARSARLGHHFQRVSLSPIDPKAGLSSQPLTQSGSATGSLMASGLKQQAQWMDQSATRIQAAQLIQAKPVAVQESTQGRSQISGGFLDWALPKELVEAKNRLGQILEGAAGVIFSILKNPVGFLGNLVTGLKKGFQNFVGNIGQYLQGGLVQWLTGALGSTGIQMPKDVFSLKGIFSLVTQVLGATWNQIRGRIVKAIPGGEEAMSALEKGTEIFQVAMKEGVGGLWEHVKDQFGDIKGQVMDQIKDMVVMQGIQQGIKFILSMLNPVSGLVRAAIGIYDIVKFFIERGKQVASLVEAVTGSIKAVAAGSVDQAAKMVESALGRSIPVLIGFLSSVAGLGNLASKVQGIFQKMKKPLDKAVDWLVQKAKDLVLKLGKKLGLVKENQQTPSEQTKGSNSEVPRSLVASNSVKIDKPDTNLMKEIAQTSSGAILFQKVGEPAQITKHLLVQHPEAKLDKKKSELKLPPLKEGPLKLKNSLRSAAAEIARQTGVSKVTLVKDGTTARLDGGINPTVYGLATYLGAPVSLDPVIKDIEVEANKQHPQKEYLQSICRDIAKKHGVTVDFVDIKKPPRKTEVHFKNLASHEQFTTEIVLNHTDNLCPACAVPSGGGTFSGVPGVRKPHNVVSGSVFRNSIQKVLMNYGVTTPDLWVAKIISAGDSPDAGGVTEDKQCEACDNAQGPWTLLQRARGVAPIGNQFAHSTQSQREQFTRDKIHVVLQEIRGILNLRTGTKDRPATSLVNTQIVAAGKIDAFLSDLASEIEAAAK